jgi:hypothetical protein
MECGGPSNCPSFRCKVIVIDSSFMSDMASSKKQARAQAALKALNSLFPDDCCPPGNGTETDIEYETYRLPETFRKAVLVDLESVRIQRDTGFEKNVAIFGYCRKSFLKLSKNFLHSMMVVRATSSALPNSISTLMAVDAGRILAKTPHCEICIESNDRSVDTVKDVLANEGADVYVMHHR